MGADVKLVGVVGNDTAGETIKILLKKLNIPLDYILSVKNLNTTKKTRFICDNSQMMRLDNDMRNIKNIKLIII